MKGLVITVPLSFLGSSTEQPDIHVEKPKGYKRLIEPIMLIGIAFCVLSIILIIAYAISKNQDDDAKTKFEHVTSLVYKKYTNDTQNLLISSCVFFGLGGISCIISIILNLREQDS